MIIRISKPAPGECRTHWTADEHMKLYGPNFNDGMASYIVNTLKPKSLLELGCGLGLYCNFIKTQCNLTDVYGIEPEPMGGVFDLPNGPIQLAIDIFKDEHPPELAKRYDLVMSIEVAEHIPREKHSFLFDFLVARANNWVVFSGARAGQGGHGHIAERPEHEWREELASRGLIYEEEMTNEIRRSSNTKNVNHRKNVMVFRQSIKR